MNGYIDTSAPWLNDEIEEALASKPRQGRRKGGKETFDADRFRKTFTYHPADMSQVERDKRLKLAFNTMGGTLIASDTHYDTFEKLFSGIPLDVKVRWIGTKAQLRMLFQLLVKEHKILEKPPGGLNQILAARFKQSDGKSFAPAQIRGAGSKCDMNPVYAVVECLVPEPARADDISRQVADLIEEEQDSAPRGYINGKPRQHLPSGTNASPTPNQHTRSRRKP